MKMSSSPRIRSPCPPRPPVGVDMRRTEPRLWLRSVRAAADGTLEWRISMRMGLNTRLRGESDESICFIVFIQIRKVYKQIEREGTLKWRISMRMGFNMCLSQENASTGHG